MTITETRTLPDHFMISDDGNLYDTRLVAWSHRPVRQYSFTYRVITTTRQLKVTLRNGEYTWPGGYPMYLIANDGEALHFNCVREEIANCLLSIRRKIDDGWRIVGCDVNWEDGELYCAHCGKKIDSAYAD